MCCWSLETTKLANSKQNMTDYKRLRTLVIKLHNEGKSNKDIKDAMKPFSVSKTFVIDTLTRYKIRMAEDRPHSGHPRTKCTPEVIKRVQEKVRRNPCWRQAKLALEHNMSHASMQKLLKEDLHVCSYHLRRAQVLSDATKKRRTDQAKEILNRMKTGTLINPVWSDEKHFTVQAVFSR